MKRRLLNMKWKSIILLIIVLIMFTCSSNAQLSVNSIAQNCTLTYIEGNPDNPNVSANENKSNNIANRDFVIKEVIK